MNKYSSKFRILLIPLAITLGSCGKEHNSLTLEQKINNSALKEYQKIFFNRINYELKHTKDPNGLTDYEKEFFSKSYNEKISQINPYFFNLFKENKIIDSNNLSNQEFLLLYEITLELKKEPYRQSRLDQP